jgi:predicted transcriptional regulator
MSWKSWFDDTPYTLKAEEALIVNTVRECPNTTIAYISQRTGLSKETVAYRVRKLTYLGYVKMNGSCGNGYTISPGIRRP